MSGSLWDALIGQEAALTVLRRDVEHDRVPGGYLFLGPPDVGKTTAARGLAQALNCVGDSRPCGVCSQCVAVAHGNPSLIQVIVPEEQGGTMRRALHKVDTIRRLLGEIGLRAFGDGTRVYVLADAGALNEEGANTLLKTLEEPPPRTVIVLTAAGPWQLLPTVVDRLRRVDLGPVATPAIEQWLRATHGVKAERAALAAGIAGGRPGRAVYLATDPAVLATREAVLELAQALGRRPPVAALLAAQALIAGAEEGAVGAKVDLALEFLEWWYRDAYRWKAAGDASGVVNRDLLGPLEAFVGRWQPAELRAGIAALEEARAALRRQGNVQLVLEVLWLRLAAPSR